MKRMCLMFLIAAAVMAMGDAHGQRATPVAEEVLPPESFPPTRTPWPSPTVSPSPTPSPTPVPTPSAEVRKIKARLTEAEEKLVRFPADEVTVSEAQLEAELRRAKLTQRSAQDALKRAQEAAQKAQARADEADTAVALAEKLLAAWKAAK